MKRLAIVMLCFILIAPIAFAHSGRTDSNGGHWDHSTGTYHYHNGGSSSSKKSSSKSSSSSSTANKPMLNPEQGQYLRTTGTVNVREGAGTNYGIVITLNPGSQVRYCGKTSGRWHYVSFLTKQGSMSGWMYNDYLEIEKTAITPTSNPRPTNTPEPTKKTTKKVSTMISFESGFYLFAAGFAVGLALLAAYSYKVGKREEKMRKDAESVSKKSYNAGVSWAKNDLYAREQSIARREKEFAEKSAEFMKEVEQIKSELPPPETYCFVLYSDFYTGYGRSLYHRINSSCISTGKRIPLYEAKMRNLYPCQKCHPPVSAKAIDIQETWKAK